MKEVKAKTGFDHDGNRVRGSKFTVSDKHALELEKKGLVEILGDEIATPPPSDGDAGGEGSAPPAPPLTDAQKFVSGTGAEIAAAIPGADKALLIAALAAEKDKGEDARKGVMEALTKATAD